MNKIERLIVCGDSFNAYPYKPEFKGTHWSELLSKQLNLPLLNFASPGCSTKLVAMQVLEALKYPNSFVIASPASHHFRFEILLDRSRARESDISLKDFETYNDCVRDSKFFLKSINANFLSIEKNISAREANTLLDFMPLGFNKFTDQWALFYALYQLKKKFVNFLFFQHSIPGGECLFNDLSEIVELVGEENTFSESEKIFSKWYIDKGRTPSFNDPGYHTTPESQQLIADIIYDKIYKRVANG